MRNKALSPSDYLARQAQSDETYYDKTHIQKINPAYGIPTDKLGSKEVLPMYRYATESWNTDCCGQVFKVTFDKCNPAPRDPELPKPGERLVWAENHPSVHYVDNFPDKELIRPARVTDDTVTTSPAAPLPEDDQ